MRAVVLVVCLLAGNLAFADELLGWKFSPPAGAKQEQSGDHVTFTKVTGKTFCQYTLFAARAPAGNDQEFEWQNVVAKNFTVKNAGKPVTKKAKHLTYVATTATLVDASKNTWAATHYFVQPAGAVSTVMLTASNAATLATCPIAAFLDSLALASAPAPPPLPPVGEFVGTVPITGRWGTSASSTKDGMSLGYQKREYVFAADGTYTWHFEAWGGHWRSAYYQIIHETGTYAVTGSRLALSPKASTQTVIEKDKKQVSKRPLEAATYTVEKTFMEGLQRNYLVLTSGKETARDGAFSSNERYKSSYLFEENANLEWKYPADR